jgi:hypothetical protein
MISSVTLPNVAFTSPPILGPVWSAKLLGRAADQPGEREDRERRGEEHQELVAARELERDRDRHEHEQPVERGTRARTAEA